MFLLVCGGGGGVCERERERVATLGRSMPSRRKEWKRFSVESSVMTPPPPPHPDVQFGQGTELNRTKLGFGESPDLSVLWSRGGGVTNPLSILRPIEDVGGCIISQVGLLCLRIIIFVFIVTFVFPCLPFLFSFVTDGRFPQDGWDFLFPCVV